MNEDVLEKLGEFCASEEIKVSKIDPSVVESCLYAYKAITLIRNKDKGIQLGFTKSDSDLLFAIRFGAQLTEAPNIIDVVDAMISGEETECDVYPVPSGLFAESTKRAKCFDILNHGKGITIVITYEKAFTQE